MNRRGEQVRPAVNVRDGNPRQLFIGYVFKAPEIDTVHDSDGRLGAHTIRTHATPPAEVVLVLLCVEEVLRQFRLARDQAETFCLRYGWPESGSPTDGAIAPIGALGQIEVGLELDGATVAAAMIGFLHLSSPNGKNPCFYARIWPSTTRESPLSVRLS